MNSPRLAALGSIAPKYFVDQHGSAYRQPAQHWKSGNAFGLGVDAPAARGLNLPFATRTQEQHLLPEAKLFPEPGLFPH